MRTDTRTAGIVAAVATIALWTGFIVIARTMALKSLSSWDVMLCRVVGASFVLLPWGASIVRRRRAAGGTAPSWLGLSPLDARRTVLTGAFGGVGYGVFAYAGFAYAPAAHASVLMTAMLPLFATLASAWLLRERPAPARLAALALILVGAGFVGGRSLASAFDGGSVWKGDLLFLVASACWSTYAVLMRRERLDPVESTVAVTVFAALAYLPAYAALALAGVIDSRLSSAPTGEILFQVAWQGCVSVAVSGIAFTTMVRAFGPVRSTMLTALVPGLSALAASVFLGEPLGAGVLAGLGLVTAGILLGARAAATTPVPPR